MHLLGAEPAVGTAAVLDIDLLAEPVGKPLATMRAIWSVPPPAGNGQIILIGRVGCPALRAGERRHGAKQAEQDRRCRQDASHGVLPELVLWFPCRHHIAAAIASPICVVLALPPRSRVSFLPSAITFVTAFCISSAAAVALASLCFRPSQPISIWPDMIMA